MTSASFVLKLNLADNVAVLTTWVTSGADPLGSETALPSCMASPTRWDWAIKNFAVANRRGDVIIGEQVKYA